jgi:hypothetical protein
MNADTTVARITMTAAFADHTGLQILILKDVGYGRSIEHGHTDDFGNEGIPRLDKD